MRGSILASALIFGCLALGSLQMEGRENFDSENYESIGVKGHNYTEIQTKELKRWYEEGRDFIVLDARNSQYFSGIMLPDAAWLPYDASERDVKNTLPSKKAHIVVYCLSSDCPMAGRLASRLSDDGYKNVYIYTAGLKVWREHGYPIIHN